MLSTVRGLGTVTGLSYKGIKNLPGMITLTKNSISYTQSAAEGSYYVKAAEKIKNSLVPISDIKKYAARARANWLGSDRLCT